MLPFPQLLEYGNTVIPTHVVSGNITPLSSSANPNFSNAECRFGSYGSDAYVVANGGTLFKYNFETNATTTLATRPIAVRNVPACVDNLGNFYAVNGYTATNRLDYYNKTTNSWTARATTPTAIWNSCMAFDYVNNLVYYGQGQSINTYTYNPATNTYTPLTSPTGAGNYDLGVGFTFCGGKLYYSNGTVLRQYDPILNTWTSYDTTPYANMFTVANGDDHLYATANTRLYDYNITTKTWTLLTSSMTVSNGYVAGMGVYGTSLYYMSSGYFYRID